MNLFPYTHFRAYKLCHRLVLCTVLVLLLVACASPQPQAGATLDAVQAINADEDSSFALVTEPRRFAFPQDHGPHPDYQTEWWYYTGNLTGADGRRFGFQLTFFRRGLTPTPQARESAWAASSIYMAHLALTDATGEQFYSFDRLSRAGLDLAGATGDPFRVFLEDWSVTGSGPQGMTMHLQAAEGPVALDLQLVSQKPPVLQGEQGYSRKGTQRGSASYYYSLTRMQAAGSLTLDGQTYPVEGLAWMDHEFGTRFLDDGAQGWDWFSVQLDDGRELMYAQVRMVGGLQPDFGILVAADGSTRPLVDVTLEARTTWQSPHTSAAYPLDWRLSVPDEGLTLSLEPLLLDQEHTGSISYWEGALRVTGTHQGQPVRGHGYAELTGYAGAGQGRY